MMDTNANINASDAAGEMPRDEASFTPKQRMLNAYRGAFSDRYPVAPEFWYYVPAKLLGVDFIEFERDVPLWKALQTTFRHYGTEGWCVAFADRHCDNARHSSEWRRESDGRYIAVHTTEYQGRTFRSARVYEKGNPSWALEYPVKSPADLPAWAEMVMDERAMIDFSQAVAAHKEVGEDYLLEIMIGSTFFDFIAGAMGFEAALECLMFSPEKEMERLRRRHEEWQVDLTMRVCGETAFESFFIGNAYSNDSLLGPVLWRRWDKPGIEAVAREIHRGGRLLHVHFHGRCMASAADFAGMGLDCVCPFERPPGGDVAGLEGLAKIRELLRGRVTMNGNVHTVDTLIRGRPADAVREVREIKEAFAGEPRLIIGTGDQVGRETPEENIAAMIEEGLQPPQSHRTGLTE
ncbi:MAG TPA: uroporphyrinogen decarboxylase family protein [Candidatus Brocadiia bacterium]|nr:uroporphyrinogen decarboxylase family protein [Candidatus Brocadiia bacterium]